MIDPIDYSLVVAAQADINDTVLLVFKNHQESIEAMLGRIEFLESELAAIQESLAYVEAGR